jgi:hypothetical protein
MDTPETFAAALLLSAAEAVAGTRAVVQKGALNIKTDAKANVQASAPTHNAHAAQTITYDTTVKPTTIEAEIGYDLRVSRSANIAWVLEYGGGKDHSPPHLDVSRALDVEEPRFLNAIDEMAGKLL